MFYLLLLAVFIIGTIYFFEHPGEWKWESLTSNEIVGRNLGLAGDIPLGLIAGIILLAVCVGTVFSPLYWEFPFGNTVASVDRNGTIQDSSRFIGVPDVPWSDRIAVNLSDQIKSAEVTVQPVTANPKVRHIVSTVSARIVNPQKYMDAVFNATYPRAWDCGTPCNIPKGADAQVFIGEIESAIYEFHEKHSVELGMFYNPHTQQTEFRDLAMRAIAPELAKKGIEMTGAKFTM